MERLLYSSSSPTPLKIHRKPTHFLSGLGRIDSPKLGFLSLSRPEFRRVNSVACKHENPSTPPNKLPCVSPLRIGSSTGSMPKFHFLNQIENGATKFHIKVLSFIWLKLCWDLFVGSFYLT